MRTLENILTKYTDDRKIVKRLLQIYPDQKKNKEGYLYVLQQLRRLKPEKDSENLSLSVKKLDIVGFVEGKEERFAMEFTKWQIWLGLPIKSTYSNLDVLCFCLWEMTFSGFNQRGIQSRLRGMLGKVKED